MDRGRRAEPYSNATIWTREIARNLAGHLSRVSKAHSCVDTRSPKSTRLPQFHHSLTQKRCPTSPMKIRQPLMTISRDPNLSDDQDFTRHGGGSAREETESISSHNSNINRKQKQELSIPQLESRQSSNAGLEINQEVYDKALRIPPVKQPAKQHLGAGDTTTYESPPILLHQRRRLSHDYCKRQEQRKIWHENQALIKRLQSTKATLNSKKWEKDDKWTQEFLKNQEKRRYALQQELRRAQISPQTVLRSKPLKSLQPHVVKLTASDLNDNLDVTSSSDKVDATGVSSARHSARRDSNGQVLLGSRGGADATVQHASAANHRRIMELRKQKPALLSSVDAVEIPSTEVVADDAVAPVASVEAFIPDNEIVTVRFTFSRGRSRDTDTSTKEIEQSDQPGSLEVEEGDRDMMSLSGAFSPGIELESELNAVAVNYSKPTGQTSEAGAGTIDDVPVEASDSNSNEGAGELSSGVLTVKNADPGHFTTQQVPGSQYESEETAAVVDIHDGISEETSIFVDPVGEENVEHHDPDNSDSGVEGSAIETENIKASPPTEAELTQIDGEEGYDGDNFDEEPLTSARAAEEQHDKHETSGYASEFEEEPGGQAHETVPIVVLIDNQSNTIDAAPVDNQEDGNDDDEYSRDDFE